MQNENPYAPPASIVDDPQAPLEEAVSLSGSELVYAGFWRRFGAYWVDGIVMLPLAALGYFVGEKTRLFYLYWFVPGLLISIWFHIYLVARYGGTPGKLLLKTRIAMLDGAAVTANAAIIRHSVLFVLSMLSTLALVIGSLHMTDASYLPLGFAARNQALMAHAPSWYVPVSILAQVWIWSEFVVMMLNKRRRAAHDFMAGTVVLRRNT